MKRTGVLAVCVLAALALSATATANEELPELGRCVKFAGAATHKYATGSCTVRSEGENSGRFEWESGPGPKDSFTSTAEASELETVGKLRLMCSSATAKGEFTGSKTELATIKFDGCEYGAPNGVLCRSTGAKEGEIVTNSLEGQLGFISGAGTSKPLVGMRLAPASGTQLAAVECSGIDVALTGSVIGTVAGAIDKMTLATTLKFRASKGRQSPEQLEGGATSVLSATAAEPEQAGLSTLESNTNEEALEVKAVN